MGDSKYMKQGQKVASKAASKMMNDVLSERDKVVSKPGTSIKKKDDIVDDLVRVVASGIGIVSEGIQHRKEKKKARLEQAQQNDVNGDEENDVEENVSAIGRGQVPERGQTVDQAQEAIWELDDTQVATISQRPMPQSATSADLQTTESNKDADSGSPSAQDAEEPVSKKKPKDPAPLARAFLNRHPYQPSKTSPNTTSVLELDSTPTGFTHPDQSIPSCPGSQLCPNSQLNPYVQLNQITFSPDTDTNPSAQLVPSTQLYSENNLDPYAQFNQTQLNSDTTLGSASSNSKLQIPVFLPQRRPKTRSRGFVRAYAPALDEVGIDRETFLDFLDTFNKVLEPNSWLYAINLAELATAAVPEPAMMLVGVGLGLAVDATIEAQSRSKSNKFLDLVNAEFFAPRGLVCLVATWKSDDADGELVDAVNFEGTAEKSPKKSGLAQDMKDMIKRKPASGEYLARVQKQMQDMIKPSSGGIRELQLAPLVFPTLEETIKDRINNAPNDKKGNKKKEKALDRGERWLDEYMDKQAQAKWKDENPDLPMAQTLPAPEFRSRYADPNHPASSGDLLALITGGKWQLGKEKKPAAKDSDSDNDSEEERRRKKERREEKKRQKEREKIRAKNKAKASSVSKASTEALKGLLKQVYFVFSAS